MPLNSATLKDSIKSIVLDKLSSNNPPADATQTENQTKLADAISECAIEIVAHLVSNGVISVTITPGTIVTAGSPTTQTGPAVPVPLTGTIA
jgi:hypothetical protein